ncbi:MAG: porin family protein [Sphingopyxis sp.]|nr:porin family protein [Sphingopyxis sp.]
MAQDDPFEGASATVIGGIDRASAGGVSETGAVYAAQLGFDIRSNNLVYGLEGELGDATTKACFATSGVCIKASRDLYIGGRLGVAIADNTLLYAKGGYSNARQTFSYQVTVPVQPGVPTSAKSDGWRVGAGIEQTISERFLVKAEYRYSDYEGGFKRHQGVVGLGIRF